MKRAVEHGQERLPGHEQPERNGGSDEKASAIGRREQRIQSLITARVEVKGEPRQWNKRRQQQGGPRQDELGYPRQDDPYLEHLVSYDRVRGRQRDRQEREVEQDAERGPQPQSVLECKKARQSGFEEHRNEERREAKKKASHEEGGAPPLIHRRLPDACHQDGESRPAKEEERRPVETCRMGSHQEPQHGIMGGVSEPAELRSDVCTKEADSSTAGPDGNIWFTEGSAQIGRITPTGTITEFPVLTISSATGITTGPDGNLWVTLYSPSKIARSTPVGVVTEFAAAGSPVGIAAGPDGSLWFVESAGNQIARITTAGVITEFPLLGVNSGPYNIVRGPDGNLWFTENDGNRIGRITP